MASQYTKHLMTGACAFALILAGCSNEATAPIVQSSHTSQLSYSMESDQLLLLPGDNIGLPLNINGLLSGLRLGSLGQ